MIYYYQVEAELDDLGVATFGALDEAKKEALVKKLKDLKVDEETIVTDILLVDLLLEINGLTYFLI